jgi:4-alpha-glucanotransferase
MEDSEPMTTPPSPELRELAAAYGVATEFYDWLGRPAPVSTDTVVAVLAAMDVDASSPDAARTALADRREQPWRRALPPYVVTRVGETPWVRIHVPHGEPVSLHVDLEDGGRRGEIPQLDVWVEPRTVADAQVGEATFGLPGDLPLGYHLLRASWPAGEATCPLVVTPRYLGLPGALGAAGAGPTWGLMTQLYQLRSHRSWGIGDLADLAELAEWGGREHGAGFVLVNPLHAASPVPPVEPSPYLPVTRRYVHPLYLRVEDVPETGYVTGAARTDVEALADKERARNATADLLDHTEAWLAKQTALGHVHAVRRTPGRQAAYDAFLRREGDGLQRFATWCVLAELHGAEWPTWPEALHDPDSPAVAVDAAAHADRVDFYCWLQWCLDEQLDAAARRAEAAGMPVGLLLDLAVGVHPDGADAWSLGSALARGVTVGAPADEYNQIGQDWSQPPWRPDRLAEGGFAPWRDMLRTVLRHAGGLRVDHAVGLFRLWWIPAGMQASEGTYVRYDHEALVGILALEAYRAGALVVGEDLGTVEPWARDYLAERGILGTSILWFERDGSGRPKPPEHWRELCLATVTTHDLPPTAGYLTAEHVRIRAKLGLLTRPEPAELAEVEADLAGWMHELRARGLVGDQAGERATIEALHRFLRRTPCRLLGISVADLVGDRRAVNQPGTRDEYPNWRVPLTDGTGSPVLLEDLVASERAASLARTLGH